MAKRKPAPSVPVVCAYHIDRPCTCIKPAVTAKDVELRRKADEFHRRLKEEPDVLMAEIRSKRSSQ